ncbi:MAG TPA: hypothetical protein VGE15_09700, partial [Sphingobacteriaceae bacterium]
GNGSSWSDRDWTPVADNCVMRLKASAIYLSYKVAQIRYRQASGVLLALSGKKDGRMNIHAKESAYESV